MAGMEAEGVLLEAVVTVDRVLLTAFLPHFFRGNSGQAVEQLWCNMISFHLIAPVGLSCFKTDAVKHTIVAV